MQKRFLASLGNVFAFFESDTSSAHGHGCRNSEYIMTGTNVKMSGVEIPQRTCHDSSQASLQISFWIQTLRLGVQLVLA
jgi:hypothetical protein